MGIDSSEGIGAGSPVGIAAVLSLPGPETEGTESGDQEQGADRRPDTAKAHEPVLRTQKSPCCS